MAFPDQHPALTSGMIANYRGVQFVDVLTNNFEQELELDPSNTDPKFQKFTITITGYLSASQVVSQNFPDDGLDILLPDRNIQEPIAEKYVRLRKYLMQPRGTFTMLLGGKILMSASPVLNSPIVREFMDVNNGPFPKRCVITEIHSTGLIKVEFTIEICLAECPPGSGSIRSVIYNRWSCSDDIDRNWYTTRIYDGYLRVAAVNLNPQSFRRLCVPPLERGFRREQMQFATSKDGLELAYRIVDVQQYASPPAPGTEWTATHTEGIGNKGYNSKSSISIQLKFPPYWPKKEAIRTVARIGLFKLDIAGRIQGQGVNPFVLEDARFVDHMHDSVVELHMSVIKTVDARRSFFNAQLSLFGTTLPANIQGLDRFAELGPYDPKVNPVPSTAPTASPAGMFISYLQSYCNNLHDLNLGRPGSGKRQGGKRSTYTPQTSVRETDNVPKPTGQNYIEDHYQKPYTEYQIETSYNVKGNMAHLPVAASQSTRASSPGGQTVAAPGKSSVVAKMAKPLAQKTVTVLGTRMGQYPDNFPPLRDRVVGGNIEKLLDFNSNMVQAKPTSGGATNLYQIRAEYLYALPDVPNLFIADRNPILNTSIPQETNVSGSFTG